MVWIAHIPSVVLRHSRLFSCVWHCMLLCFAIPSIGQEYLYVNTDNLILRDRPGKKYNVFAILHAPCQVKLEPYDDDYKNNRAVKEKFYRVSISYTDSGAYGIHHHIGGWVMKKYMVTSQEKVTVRGADKRLAINASELLLEQYMGDGEHNPNNGNSVEFLPPEYKGGEAQPETFKRVYHSGPRGGCYYMSRYGNKVYVNGKYCHGK